MSFKPKGDTALWVPLYELFAASPDDVVISYNEMVVAMDLDPEDPKTLPKVQATALRAGQRLETENKRAIENVAGVGYKVVVPAAQLQLAAVHHRKARKALDRSHSKVVNIDYNRIDAETRARVEGLEREVSREKEALRRVERMIAKHDWTISALQQETTQIKTDTSNDLHDMKARQARMEAQLNELAKRLG